MADTRHPIDWCDTAFDDCSDLFTPPGTGPSGGPPFIYGQGWPHAGAWIDPWNKTVHLED